MVDARLANLPRAKGLMAALMVAALACADLLGSGGDARAGSATPAGLMVDLCALGVWRGRIKEPGFGEYAIRLEIAMRRGAVAARAEYPELACVSRGDLLEVPTARRMRFREVVTKNRETCADGFVTVTCMGGGRLHWRWRWDDGETFDAMLTR